MYIGARCHGQHWEVIHQAREHQGVGARLTPPLPPQTTGRFPGCFSACFLVSATENSLNLRNCWTATVGSARADFTRKRWWIQCDEIRAESSEGWCALRLNREMEGDNSKHTCFFHNSLPHVSGRKRRFKTKTTRKNMVSIKLVSPQNTTFLYSFCLIWPFFYICRNHDKTHTHTMTWIIKWFVVAPLWWLPRKDKKKKKKNEVGQSSDPQVILGQFSLR